MLNAKKKKGKKNEIKKMLLYMFLLKSAGLCKM